MFLRRESFADYLRRFPILSVIIGLNALAMLYVIVNGGLSDDEYVIRLGGMMPEAVTSHEYWRFLTSSFLHLGMAHFLTNMFFLYVFVPPAEALLGKMKFIGLFLFSAIGSSLFVYSFGSQYAAGASGFAYGVLGFYVYLCLAFKQVMDKESAKIIYVMTALGFISSVVISGISLSGHAGGFAGGLLFGALFVRRKSRTSA